MPKAAECDFPLSRAPDAIRPTGDAVSVAVIRILPREDLALPDGFEQTESDQLRCDTRRQACLRVQRAVSQHRGGIIRLAQADAAAVAQRQRNLFVADRETILGPVPGNRETLQLQTVGGLRNVIDMVPCQRLPLVFVLRRDVDPQ